jgi:metacaspase-1
MTISIKMFMNSVKLFAILFGMLYVSTNTFGAEKRALLVGIGTYTVDSDWGQTHGDNDVVSMSKTLQSIGFNNITKIVNSQATKSQIILSLNQIYDACAVGDVVLFYFSGHGQLILDYNADELDGYDESLVCYGAPKNYDALYKNENHLLDEELSEIINKFRMKLSELGEFICVVDAGYGWNKKTSSHYTRGGALPLEYNYETHPFENIGKNEVGIIDDLPFSRPYPSYAHLFNISASDIMNVAYELNGNGLLTLAFARSLELPLDSMNYQDLFESIKKNMQLLLSDQTPAAEGLSDVVVFHLFPKQGTKTQDLLYMAEHSATVQETVILNNITKALKEEFTRNAKNPEFGVY